MRADPPEFVPRPLPGRRFALGSRRAPLPRFVPLARSRQPLRFAPSAPLRIAALVSTAALAAGACGAADETEPVEPPTPGVLEVEIRDHVATVNRAFSEAVARGNAEAMAAVYTDDAVLLPPGSPPVQGREAIAEFFRGMLDATGLAAIDLETREVRVDGATAYEVGRARLTFRSPESETTSTAKYVVVWKRTDRGWRWHVDIWNDDPPPGATAAGTAAAGSPAAAR